MGTILLFVFEHAVYTSFAINLKNSFHCAVNDYAKDHSCERATLPVTHKHFSVLCQGFVIILFVCLFVCFCLYQHCPESYWANRKALQRLWLVVLMGFKPDYSCT